MAKYGIVLFAAFVLIGCLALKCVICSFSNRSPRMTSTSPATMATTTSPIATVSPVFNFPVSFSTYQESPIIPCAPPPSYDSLFPDKVISDN